MERRIGVYDEASGELVDVASAYAQVLATDGEGAPREIAAAHAPREAVAFLRRGERAMEAARRALEYDGETGLDGESVRYGLDEVRLLSPVPRPNSIRDYTVVEEHVRNEFGDDIPDQWFEIPFYYKGDVDCVGHPNETIEWPSYSKLRDFEFELAAVLGQEGRNVPAEEADQYIAGYTIFNDLSARDTQVQELHYNFGPSKSKDFADSNVFGPFLVTPEELDVENTELTVYVNGEEWSSGTLGPMQHSFAEIIEHTSRNKTMYPGDVLGSGTFSMGCGLDLDRYLEPGDTIALEAEGIGTLQNTIVDG